MESGRFSFSWRFFLALVFAALSSCRSDPGAQTLPNQEPAATPTVPADPVVQRGTRVIGMDFLNTTPASSFEQNLALAKAAGASAMHLHVGWNAVEPTTPANCTTAGSYTDPISMLAIFDSVLSSNGLSLSLGVLPSTTNVSQLPSNLSGKALDDALVICRFEMMLDYVFSKLPTVNLVNLQLGNELEAMAASNTVAFWGSYWNFLSAVSTYVRNKKPGLKIGVAGNLYAQTGTGPNPNTLAKGGYQQLNLLTDYVGVNYYPMDAAFSVKDPTVIDGDLDALAAVNPAKPISFQEIGYQSGSLYDQSSEDKQAQFIHAVFKAWDHYPTQVYQMTFLRMNDVSHADAQGMASGYGSVAAPFVEYLETLGLRTYSGVDKAAFRALKDEAKKRGW